MKRISYPAITTNYDPIGRMLSLTDQVGSITRFQYDNRNLLLKKTDPLLKDTVYGYDDAGRLTSVKDRNLQTITFSYTPTDGIDTITYPDASTVKFSYDLDDCLIMMTDPLGITTYGYDDAKRLKDYTNAFGSKISYDYDAAGNVTKLTYPDGKAVTYTYDSLNRIKTVTNWLSQTAIYTYDATGRLKNFVNFNGTITKYDYDEANRLTTLAHTKSDTTTALLNYTFTLDNNGNRKQITQLEPLSTTINLGTTGYVYNSTKNRLTSFGSLTFTYDDEGQTATQGGSTYVFDAEHRLKSIGTGITYSYDGSSRRIKVIRYGAETRYIYDASGNLLGEADSINKITKYYIYGAGLLATVNAPDSKIYCYHFNSLGSTIALTDSTQAIVNKYAYTPFSVLTEQETVNQPFKYVGQYGVMAESNGLYYMRARYYDPSVGRFISEDPIGLRGGVNLFAYVGGNPISNIDPSGLDTYYINNEFGSSNPTKDYLWSHSFIAITERNSKGEEVVAQTFSWVNKNGGMWEDTTKAQNRIGAQKAIESNVGAVKMGGSDLDYFVKESFDLKKDQVGVYDLFVNNCKDQALDLIISAKKSEGWK